MKNGGFEGKLTYNGLLRSKMMLSGQFRGLFDAAASDRRLSSSDVLGFAKSSGITERYVIFLGLKSTLAGIL